VTVERGSYCHREVEPIIVRPDDIRALRVGRSGHAILNVGRLGEAIDRHVGTGRCGAGGGALRSRLCRGQEGGCCNAGCHGCGDEGPSRRGEGQPGLRALSDGRAVTEEGIECDLANSKGTGTARRSSPIT